MSEQKFLNKTNLLYLLIIILCISNISLIFRIRLQHKIIGDLKYKYLSQQSRDKLRLKKFPDFQMKEIKEGKIFSLNTILSQKSHTLFVFFSPSDCGACLFERILWQDIYNKGIVNVVGISSHNIRESKKWVNQTKLSIPILYDENGKLRKLLGIKRTPIKILIDQQRNILIADDSVRLYKNTRKDFLNLLYRKIGRK